MQRFHFYPNCTEIGSNKTKTISKCIKPIERIHTITVFVEKIQGENVAKLIVTGFGSCLNNVKYVEYFLA